MNNKKALILFNMQEVNIPDVGMTMNLNGNPAQITTSIYPYQEITYLSTLSPRYQLILSNSRPGGWCCTCGKGIKGNFIFLIIMSVFTSGFSLIAKYTALSNIGEYKNLQEKISENEKEVDKVLKLYYVEYNPNYFRYDKFWSLFGDFENKIIMADILCPLILLIFLIIEIIIYNTVLKKETKSSSLRGIIVLFNCLFYVLFNILFALVLYLAIYSIVISSMRPSYFGANSIYLDEENEWIKKRFSKLWAIHIIVLVVLVVFTFLLTVTDKTIFFLLEMYNDDDDNNIQNSNLDKIKTKSIFIGNQNIDMQINLNKCIYLKDLAPEGKTYEFRQILLEKVRNDYLYISIENPSIRNMLSISSWKYPNTDPMISDLKRFARAILFSLIICFLPILFHINDQYIYQQLKKNFDISKPEKIKFISIFKIVGNFEKVITTSRFYIYVAILFILYLFMLKRLYFGGFSRLIYIKLSVVLIIILIIIHLIFLILSLCLAIFSILSIITVYNFIAFEKKNINAYNSRDKLLLVSALIIQATLSCTFFTEMFKSPTSTLGTICSCIFEYKENLLKLNAPNEIGKTEFQYNGLDSNPHILTEVIIPGHPRYLYYSLNKNKDAIENNNNDILNLNTAANKVTNTNRFDEEAELKISTEKI